MSTIIYHNPRCQKSRETLALLENEGEDVEVIEYLKEVPTAKALKEILSKLKLKAEQLVRKKEPLYQQKYLNKKLTDAQWIKVMIENPILMERPIVMKGKKAAIGRPPEAILDIL